MYFTHVYADILRSYAMTEETIMCRIRTDCILFCHHLEAICILMRYVILSYQQHRNNQLDTLPTICRAVVLIFTFQNGSFSAIAKLRVYLFLMNFRSTTLLIVYTKVVEGIANM